MKNLVAEESAGGGGGGVVTGQCGQCDIYTSLCCQRNNDPISINHNIYCPKVKG